MNFVIEIIYRENVTVRKSNSHFPFLNDNVLFLLLLLKMENCINQRTVSF